MTTAAITELGRGHLATLMCEIRADWDIAGCVAALRRISPAISAAAIGIAAMRYAADERNLTPAHLADLANHAWDSTGYPPCPVHGNSARRVSGECGGCYADRTGDEHSTAARTPTPPPRPLRQLVGDTRRSAVAAESCPASERTLDA